MNSSAAAPEPAGFAAFYDALCSELRRLGVEGFRAEFDALDADRERVEAVLRLQSAGRLQLDTAQARTGKSAQQARHYLDLASNCTDGSRKLVLCNTALQHCPLTLQDPAVRDLYWAICVNRLWALLELGRFSAGLEETSRLLAEPELLISTDTRVQLMVERARFQAALAQREAAEKSVADVLKIVRQLERPQQAMYATELGSVRKRLASGEPPLPDRSRPTPPVPARLFGGEHAHLRRVTSAVELTERERRGRCLVANTDIPAGSLVMVDEPFAWCLHPPRWSTHCQNCCRPLDCALPCPHCASVLFCSDTCRSEATRCFHGAECAVLDLLIEPQLGRMALLVYRLLARAGADTLRRYSADPAPTQPADYDSLDYGAVYGQVANTAERPMGDVVKRTAVALYLTACLEQASVCPAADRVTIAALALRHLQSCSCNAYEITELHAAAGGVPGGEFEELGGAVYAAVSLTNHSCYPNLVRASRGRGVHVTTGRPLRAGDELLDNYGFHFHEEDEMARYEALRRQYQFQCECAACENGWPQYGQLAAGAAPGERQKRAVEQLVQGEYAAAAEALAALVTADDAQRQPTAAPDKQAVQRLSLLTRCIQGRGNLRHQ